jgi:hypothetical protein
MAAQKYKIEDMVNTAARHDGLISGWTLLAYVSYAQQWDGREYETVAKFVRYRMSGDGHSRSNIDKCEALYANMKKVIDSANEKGRA